MPSNTLLSARARKLLHAGELILDGFDNDEIAEVFQCVIRAVSRWRKKLKDNNDDLCTLLRKKGTGQSPILNDEQKHPLKEIILKGVIAAGYPNERWTSKIVADLIQKTFNITLAPRTVRHLLRNSVSRRRCLLPNHANEIDKPSNVGKMKRFMISKKSRKRGYVPCFLGRKRIFDIADPWSDLGIGRQADCVTINVFTTYANKLDFHCEDSALLSIEL